jgi:catechol 2,3-dioxygenase
MPRLNFSHIGFHVRDLDAMIDFYTKLIGLELTDRGMLRIPGEPQIAFLSSDAEEHHQIALVEGRSDAGDEPSVINQISFHVESLGALREMKSAAEAFGVKQIMPLSHGNAWSIYFADPEGNGIEVFARSPWHVRQPVTDGLDLSQSDEEIVERTGREYASQPDFESAESWRAAFAKRLENRWRDRGA